MPAVALGMALEVLGALAIFVFVALLDDPGGAVGLPLLDVHLRPAGQGGALLVVAVVVVLLGAKSLYQASLVYARSRVAHGTWDELTSRLFRAYLTSPYALRLRQDNARRMARMQSGVERAVRHFLEGLVGVLSEALVVIGLLVVLVIMSPLAASGAALAMAVLGGGLVFWFHRRIGEMGRAVQEGEERRHQVLEQGLEGLKLVKVMGAHDFFLDLLERRQAPLMRARTLFTAVSDMPRPLVEALFVAGAGIMFALLLTAGTGGTAPLALLGLYAYAGFRIIPSFNRILFNLSLVLHGAEAVEPVVRDLATAPEIPARRPPGAARPTVPASPSWTMLTLENVTYRYPGQDRPALREVGFSLRRGEALGVFGSTGAGKSTLLDLMLGLLEPTSGEVRLDGEPLASRRTAWQRGLGYVPQDSFVLSDTLRRNVAFGVSESAIDDDRVLEVLRVAKLEPLVASLPRGIATVIGDGAIQLSGGERQRLAVARALYRDPSLLVLDEATSALDQETEALLWRSIAALPGDRTLLVVSHRPTLIQACDRIVFVSLGEVAEVGTWDRLLETRPDLRAIVRE